jgi:hypothetical protein
LLRSFGPLAAFAVVASTALGQGSRSPRASGLDAAAFDLLDRRAQELFRTVRCARYFARLRAEDRFGPRDSLGGSGHCLVIEGHSVGIFLDIDSTGKSARRLAAVALADGNRYVAPLDTAPLVARTVALHDAMKRGSDAYTKADRQFVPLALWPTTDSLQVWLVPASVFAGKGLGGERGFIYASDGRTLIAEIDAFAKYRPFQLPDIGTVLIESDEIELPILSEMVLANLLNDSGRPVAILTKRYQSSLVGRAASAMWVHVPRR